MTDNRGVLQGFERLERFLAEVYVRRSIRRRKRSLRHQRDRALPIFACVQESLELAAPTGDNTPSRPCWRS